MKIQFLKLNSNAHEPLRATEGAAGCDLFALIDDKGYTIIHPHRTEKIRTGIAVAIPEGYFGAVYARSGLAYKDGLRPANCVGVIDADYRGEIVVALHNDSEESRYIKNGDRVAQLVITPYLQTYFEETDNLSETLRGSGGFGSTGK